jgi:hypothetical protein
MHRDINYVEIQIRFKSLLNKRIRKGFMDSVIFEMDL